MPNSNRSRSSRVRPSWTLLLLCVPLLCTGCVTLTGPNKVRKQIAEQEDVTLEKEFGITVGPLGVMLADMVASNYIPVDMSGISWVDYGEYNVSRNVPSAEPFCLRNLELPGWERIIRVCERDEDIIVLARDQPRLRELLVIQRENTEVRIVRAEGDLERVLEELFDSDLVDDEMSGMWAMLGGGAPEVTVTHDVTMPGMHAMAMMGMLGRETFDP